MSQSACKKDSRGRKPRDPREVLNGILWVLRTDTPWKDLPGRYPPPQTCPRRFFQQWVKAGVFRRVLEELARDFLQERGKGSRIMAVAEAALDSRFISGLPKKLIGDKAYDSDQLNEKFLKKHSVELIAPHRRNRKKPKTQDGRYKRRWKVERRSHGFRTSDGWLSGMNVMLTIF